MSTSRIVVPTLLFGTVPWPHFPGLTGLAEATKGEWHDVGEFAHVNLVYVLYALFALHIAGALKHHFTDQDGNIGRMVPGTKRGTLTDPRLLLIGFGVLVATFLVPVVPSSRSRAGFIPAASCSTSGSPRVRRLPAPASS